MAQGLLKNIYLFEHFTEAELGAVEKTIIKHRFDAGEEIFSQGQAADSLYVIAYGSVRIQQEIGGGEVVIRPLATGSHFGEMALIDERPRSATVTAIEHTEVLEISYAGLQAIFAEQPALAAKLYRSLAHFLSGRLRETTSQLGFARSHFRPS
ncbi:MAG: cyclic nucleotide-binding domain-containing protein [Oceanococcaceae bacterium]